MALRRSTVRSRSGGHIHKGTFPSPLVVAEPRRFTPPRVSRARRSFPRSGLLLVSHGASLRSLPDIASFFQAHASTEAVSKKCYDLARATADRYRCALAIVVRAARPRAAPVGRGAPVGVDERLGHQRSGGFVVHRATVARSHSQRDEQAGLEHRAAHARIRPDRVRSVLRRLKVPSCSCSTTAES